MNHYRILILFALVLLSSYTSIPIAAATNTPLPPTATPTLTITPTRAATRTSTSAPSSSAIKNVFVIVMENTDWSRIVGNMTSAPYINSLLAQPDVSYAKNFRNVLPSEVPGGYLHPSEPNYIWLEAATNQFPDYTFTTNDPPRSINSTSSPAHLTTYLNNAGISWKAYAEDISGTTCPTTDSYPYAPRHNPFVFFQDVTNNTAYCISHVRPFTELATDLTNNTPARYNFIIPNLCNDMHDATGCSGATGNEILNGDNWLKNNLPTILNSSTYKNEGAVFITWDEDSGAITNNPIGMIVVSPFAKGNGYNNTIAYSFSSLIKTLQETFGVTPFLANAASATDLSDLFAIPLTTSTPTVTKTSTRTRTPTITPRPTKTPEGVGALCIMVYRNITGTDNSILPLVTGAQVTVKTLGQVVVQSWTTNGTEPHCFTGLTPNSYIVSEINPPGYLSFTPDVVTAVVAANNTTLVWFGDQLSSTTPTKTVTPTPSQTPTPIFSRTPIYHLVQPGETLSSIARLYGVSTWTIAYANRLWNPNLIYVGMVLVIPQTGATAPTPTRSSAPSNCYYTVRYGDTLSLIAWRFGVDAWSIARANGLYGINWIYAGQRLLIPGCQAPPPTSTPTNAPTKTPTNSASPTPTITTTNTSTPTPTRTPTNSASSTPTITPTNTSTPTRTPTNTPSPTPTSTPTPSPTPVTPSIYWGAYISGSIYGINVNPPDDLQAIDIFESHAGKKMSMLHWGLRWYHNGSYEGFDTALMEKVRQRGLISLLDWESSDYGINPEYDQPIFSLSTIINGAHDAYIRQWATDAKNWGYPFFLRFDYEMNGDWNPWSESRNGNSAGQYVQAWRHVHDIFTQVGATNVTWVWCPNIESSGATSIDGLYPGDTYVDWTCMDGYNWGTNPSRPIGWQTFNEIFKPTYDHILRIAPTKPMMIGETSSSEYGGSKAAWFTDALAVQLPNNFPNIKALAWFNVNADNLDWVIETSSSAQSAFAAGVASDYYSAKNFRDLATSPISPLR